MVDILDDLGIIYTWSIVVFSSSKVGFEYILVCAKTKEKSHKNLSSYGFWRRARDSIRATAVAWSLAVTTVHRTVALCRSSFESLLDFCKQKRTDTARVSVPFHGGALWFKSEPKAASISSSVMVSVPSLKLYVNTSLSS